MLFSIKSIHSKRCPTIELSVYIKKEFTWLISRVFLLSQTRLGYSGGLNVKFAVHLKKDMISRVSVQNFHTTSKPEKRGERMRVNRR